MTPRRDPTAGLTLIETLAVLAIIGIMAGVTLLGLGALGHGDRARTEAMRLVDRLQLASDAALVSGAPIALVWDARGYRFLRWNAAGQAWQPDALRLLAARHALPAELRLELPEGRGTPPLLITPDLPEPGIVLRVGSGAAAWRVTFDGFTATAAPERRDG